MKRWNLVTGLAVIVVVLLVLGGYSVTVIQSLTADIDQLITTNYDSIRAARNLRSGMTRLDAHYRAAALVDEIPKSRALFDHERDQILAQLSILQRNSEGGDERAQVESLETYLKEYFATFGEYLALAGKTNREARQGFELTAVRLAQLTGSVADAANGVVDANERQLLAKRDLAVERGKRAQYVTLGIAALALLLYLFASIQLARGIYRPLRSLRDAMVRVQKRRFEQPVEVDGNEELSQIAAAFNRMAAELRKYIEETDEKAVQAARDCRAVLAALPHPVFIVNEDYSVRLSNSKADLWARTLEVEGTLPPMVRRQVDEQAGSLAPQVDHDMRRVIDAETLDEQGNRIKVSYLPQAFRLEAPQGVNEGWAVLLLDVTRIRRLDEAKTKAISTLGHEVKTPITGIRMTLHLLLEEKLGPLNPDQRELLQAGRDDCERLLAVLHSLMELARLESGRTPFKIQPTAVSALLNQSAAMHASLVKNSGRELIVDEQGAQEIMVYADILHAERVLGNYLSNAIKYGLPETAIELRSILRADGYVRLSVINQAARPISEAEQTKVFDPFFRRAGEQKEGAGLGLTIAREIALAQGGRVGVWCEGTRVEFFLDLRLAATPQRLTS